MAWSGDDAKMCCDALLKVLSAALPDVNWEESGSLGENGLLFFVNDRQERVRVVVSRQALELYRVSDSLSKGFQEKRLVSYMRVLRDEQMMAMFIGPDHLRPPT